MKLPRTVAKNARKVFYFIHLWTGLVLGLWFVAIGLTGSVLAWRSEWTTWETRSRVGAPNPGPNDVIIPVSRAIAAFKAGNPDLKPERSVIYVPADKLEFRQYRINARGKINGKDAPLIFLVNPVTGQAYPLVSRETMWVPWMETFHSDLLAEARGSVAKGFFSLFALFLLLSGAWLWWPSSLAQFKRRITFKRGVSLHRVLYDFHNALGVYLYGLLFLLTLTAVLLVWDGQTKKSIATSIDRKMDTSAATRKAHSNGRSLSGGTMPVVAPSGTPLGVDELVAKAKAAVPNKTLVTIKLPLKPNQPFQASFDPIGFNSGVEFFNPYSGDKIEATEPTHSPGSNLMKTVGNLHYGWFGGVWSQFFYGLSGLLPLGLYITGVWMWINKKRGQLRLKAKRAADKLP